MPTSATTTPFFTLLAAVQRQAEASGRFGPVQLTPDPAPALSCAAKDAPVPAFYRLFIDADRPWIAFATADRWLSQSIEQDLVHTGDKIESLVHDELIDHDYDGPAPLVEHFRSPALEYTFRSPLPISLADAATPAAAAVTGQFLLGYEACFASLGDVAAGPEQGDESDDQDTNP